MDAIRGQLTGAALALMVSAATACGETPSARAARHVDSVSDRTLQMARFREGLPVPAGLTGGAPSRDALVRRFAGALEKGDTVTLGALVMTKAEFAYLYYPTNPEAYPPYDLEPALSWFLLEGKSRRGLGAALRERSGRPLEYLGHQCDEPASRQDENTVWGPCTVTRLRSPGDTITERLFAQIVERDGVYKFVSYANKL